MSLRIIGARMRRFSISEASFITKCLSFGKALILVTMVASQASCGSDQIDVVANIVYADNVEAQVLQPGVTARIWYRSNATGTEVKFQPAQTKPRVLTGTVGGANVSALEPHTATDVGYTFTSGSVVQLRNLPLNQTGLEIGIEFMKVVGDQPFVFAYGVYQGPTDQSLSEEALKADLESGLAIYFGRSCGQVIKQQCSGAMPTDVEIQVRCGASPPRYPPNC